MKFIGRQEELNDLKSVINLKKSSLIVCNGRRRIGKSRLISEFAKINKLNFWEFQGLSPREGITNSIQLDNFSLRLSMYAKIPQVKFSDWTIAFDFLFTQLPKTGKTVIFLDEISWMAEKDRDFPGKLKIFWDTKLNTKDNFILILCGSVSSWIQNNILQDTSFVGRISKIITLKEFTIDESLQFFETNKLVSSYELMKILTITGGIPRYLEEMDLSRSAEQNILEACFKESGFLFNEFNSIFHDIFGRKSKTFKQILLAIINYKNTFTEIAKSLQLEKGNGTLLKYLDELELSGFIKKYKTWEIAKSPNKKNAIYRVSDNYIRFYLKYIHPNEDKIKNNLFKFKGLDLLPGIQSFFGYQFENLIFNNFSYIVKKLCLDNEKIEQIGPYIQRGNAKLAGCQIDLLIQTKDCIYVCEIKYRKKIPVTVIQEVKNKIEILKYPKGYSIRTILIYQGELDEEVLDLDYFDKVISLTSPHNQK